MKPTFEQNEEFYRQVAAGRINRENYQRFVDNPDRYDTNLGRFGRIHETVVNYHLSLPGLIDAARQDFVSDDLTVDNFHIEGKGVRKVGLELYEFDRTVTGPEGVEIIEADGYQLEGPAELCAFIAVNRIAQLRRPIVAWKVRWQTSDQKKNLYDDVVVPYANQCNGGGRVLYLTNFKGNFLQRWQVLVSRKPELG